MPNVLDAEPLRALARRAGKKIEDATVRARFERLAFAALMDNANNFQTAGADALRDPPAWALSALARGETVSVCKLDRGAAMRVHAVARCLAVTCKLASADPAKRPHQAHIIAEARAFVRKIERVSFEIAGDKARRFALLWVELDHESDFHAVCPAATIAATAGRRWERITSLADLRAVGREFRNCLARADRHSPYGASLCEGRSQYWVLRDRAGKGLVVARASAPFAEHFDEAKAPRNGSAIPYRFDLLCLATAIGTRPDGPPTAPAGASAPARRRCLCLLCRPRAHGPPLPVRASPP